MRTATTAVGRCPIAPDGPVLAHPPVSLLITNQRSRRSTEVCRMNWDRFRLADLTSSQVRPGLTTRQGVTQRTHDYHYICAGQSVDHCPQCQIDSLSPARPGNDAELRKQTLRTSRRCSSTPFSAAHAGSRQVRAPGSLHLVQSMLSARSKCDHLTSTQKGVPLRRRY